MKSPLVLLCNENYATWKVQAKMCLMKEDLWRIVNGTETAPTDAGALTKFNIRKDRALAIIVLAVDPRFLYLLGDPECPTEVWRKLQDVFQKKSWSNKLRLKKKLYNMKLTDEGNLQEHLKNFVELFDAMAVVGDVIKDEDRVITLLASLPQKFDTLVTTLESLDTVPTWEAVTERLLRADEKISDDSGEKAFYSKNRNNMKNIQCFECGKFGHIRRFCPKIPSRKETARAQVAAQDNGTISDDEIALSATSTNENIHDGFLLDSACTSHISHDRSLFSKFNSSNEKNVVVGDGKMLKVEGEGEIILNVRSVSGGHRKCTLKNVLYVPEISHNLLSVPKISAGGKIVQFTDKLCKITDGYTTLAYGRKVGNLYILMEAASRPNIMADENFCQSSLNPCRKRWPPMSKENAQQSMYALSALNCTGARPARLRIRCMYKSCNHASCK